MAEVPAGAPPSLEQLRETVARAVGLRPDEIPDDADLVQLGLDSLGVMRLVNRWRLTGIRVTSRELVAEPTLSAWHRQLTDLAARTLSEQPRT